MNSRVNYKMTEEDLQDLLQSMQPVAYILMGGSTPPTQQENANRAWARLGKRMGFDPMSVKSSGSDRRNFTAVPSEVDPLLDEEKMKKAQPQQEFPAQSVENID